MDAAKILHVDVDADLSPYLTVGRKTDISLTPETVSSLDEKETVEVLTFKSQSRLTADTMSHFPNLKLLVARIVGVNNVDEEVCRTRNIALYRIPDYGPETVAEHALALLLAGARHVVRADAEVRTGVFSYKHFLGMKIKGKTVGVAGTGKIGLSFIHLINAFGVRVLAYDVFKNEEAAKTLGFTYVPLEELLENCDVLSIHVPLLPETQHLIGEKELMSMKKKSIIVNTSRGALIDTQALIKHASKFHAICLDVVEGEEKFAKDHPILMLPNVILTPHIGFFTDESVKMIAGYTMENIESFEKGEGKNRII